MTPDHDEPKSDRPSPRRSYALGVVVALGGALALGMLSVATGYRLVWLAPLIGLLVAVVLREGAPEPGPRIAVPAVGLTLAGLVFAQIVAGVFGMFFVSAREIRQDPGLVYEAVAVYLGEHGEPIPQTTSLIEYELALTSRINGMSETDKRSIVRWYLNWADSPVVRVNRPGGVPGPGDLWWWVGALVVTYFVARRRKTPAPPPVSGSPPQDF